MTRTSDAVVVGSGHNGLVTAPYMAQAGLAVQVLGRCAPAGGAVRSEELTELGLIHATFSATHTVFKLSMPYAELGEELPERGLRYCEPPDETTVTVLADGRVTLASRDIETLAGSGLRDDGMARRSRSSDPAAVRYRPWASRFDDTAIIHLTGGLDPVSLACAQAGAGLLLAEPTVVVGQPAVLDRSRAPEDAGVTWIQLEQVPYAPRGDAGGAINVGNEIWSDDLVAAFTTRVLAALEPIGRLYR